MTLFILQNILVEYLRVGSGENISGLAEVMQKYLREFANKVLRLSLPRLSANMPNMPKDLNMKELTSVLAQVCILIEDFIFMIYQIYFC